jgi:hypothetical protein
MTLTWNEERDAEMVRLIYGGLSRAKVARRLGVSKNSVIGRMVKLGQLGRLPRQAPPRQVREALPRPPLAPGAEPAAVEDDAEPVRRAEPRLPYVSFLDPSKQRVK